MKRILLLIACFATLAACGSDSALPNPTGKGAVRMINAIPGSPGISISIEQLFLENVGYKESSSPAPYDDFSYIFHFDTVLPGDSSVTRIASRTLTVEKDRDHIFMLSGDLSRPTVTILDGDIREFDTSATVFEVRFAHGSSQLGDIDIYIDPIGTVPGTNPPAATLAFGEIGEPADYEAGDYVLTITDANDLGTVRFTAEVQGLLAQFAHVMTVFDGDGNDTAPVTVRSMTSVGNPLDVIDGTFPPQIRLVHAAFELPSLDVYDDDQLTSLVTSDLAFSSSTPNLDATFESRTLYFTEAGSTAQILFESAIAGSDRGTFAEVYVIGSVDDASAIRVVPDRASLTGTVKVRLVNSAANLESFEVYLVERGEVPTEDDNPILLAPFYPSISPDVLVMPGSYDLYVAEEGTLTTVSAALPLDVADGDVVSLIVVDTVDPAIVEVVDVSTP